MREEIKGCTILQLIAKRQTYLNSLNLVLILTTQHAQKLHVSGFTECSATKNWPFVEPPERRQFLSEEEITAFFFFSVNVKEANKHLHGGLSINWAVASIYSNVVYGTNRQTMVRDLETNYSLGDSTTWYHCITAKGSALRRWQRPLINTRETLFRNDATLAWKLQLSIS